MHTAAAAPFSSPPWSLPPHSPPPMLLCGCAGHQPVVENCQSTTAVPPLLYCRSEKSVASTATSGPSSPSSPVTSSPGGTTPGRWRQKSSFSLLVTSGPAMQPSLSRSSSVHSLWLRAGQHEDADQGHQALGTSPSTACSSVHTATAAC